MAWQVFNWHEIADQAKSAAFTERLQPALDWTGAATQESLRLIGAFLTPAALSFAALGIWRFSSDLGITGDFFVEDGIFSRWQVWIALAFGARAASVALDRRLKNCRHPAGKS